MINEIKISNFKSVRDLTLPLGRFNVLIGSNGSGKSNILEAIAFGGAASADKLDNEFLSSRGIRSTNSRLIKSAFPPIILSAPISLKFISDSREINFTINEEKNSIGKWNVKEKTMVNDLMAAIALLAFVGKENREIIIRDFDENAKQFINIFLKDIEDIATETNNGFDRLRFFRNDHLISKVYAETFSLTELSNFIIFSPEISSLRKFDEESQIRPLGIKGEGLFNVLEIFYENYGAETINKIREYLHIIEWFDNFEAVFDRVTGRKSLVVRDRNIPDVTFNQNEVNEGFLFLLFYISLMISKETPSFFAIDNIEASFHPILCEELIRNLVKLSKEHNKQIILTTHNPFVLDGLDINDSDQKLFVVRRDAEGATIADNITKSPKNIKLSEAWLRGRIGGNPETIQ